MNSGRLSHEQGRLGGLLDIICLLPQRVKRRCGGVQTELNYLLEVLSRPT
jgi:hypothetical protein